MSFCDDADTYFEGIDVFCMLAGDNEALLPLSNGKRWLDYKLSSLEWKIIDLAQDCLKV